ncbi:MAG: PLP-dependent aminotransferase family protein [Polyangiaceae bacterium]
MQSIAARLSAAGALERGAGSASSFVRIAAAISDEVRRGALRAGDRLPSSRALARELGVNRNTVIAAFDELSAQGWVESRGAAGTFVTGDFGGARKHAPAATRGLAARPGYTVRAIAPSEAPFGAPDALYQLSAGVPDVRLFPHALLSRAYRRALRSRDGRRLLDYGSALGAPRLRAAIAAFLRDSRGVPATESNVLVTRGSQQAIDLAARLLTKPGDTIAVEALGYRPAWRVFEEARARLAPITLDDAGAVVDEVVALEPRCVYLTPHHQYPTTVTLSPARRMALLSHAARMRFAVLEDDYDHEFHFEGRPVAPLAAHDPSGQVLYVGTLSKILAPGLRLGFVTGPEPIIRALGALRGALDRQGDHVLECAVAELFEDGEVERHARKMRGIYRERRDALVDALARHLGGALEVRVPDGGITLWARVSSEIDLEAWCARAAAARVAFVPARYFALDGRARPFVRLGFARHDEAELLDAVKRLKRALSTSRATRAGRVAP